MTLREASALTPPSTKRPPAVICFDGSSMRSAAHRHLQRLDGREPFFTYLLECGLLQIARVTKLALCNRSKLAQKASAFFGWRARPISHQRASPTAAEEPAENGNGHSPRLEKFTKIVAA